VIWLELIGGFLLFMALLGGAHALDRRALERYGYRPFALPNLAFMLIPHGVLLAWILGRAPGAGLPLAPLLGWILVALGAGGLILMLAILLRRTSPGIALAAVVLMLAGAPVLLLSVLFRELSGAPLGR
jgi:hypothetical protein